MYFLKLILCVLLGFAVARLTGDHTIEETKWYELVVSSLLAVGLYASTYGIDLKEAHKHLKIIVSAVTVGVVLKATIIGGTLALLFQDPFFLILGVTVAQIDPLSVANLMQRNRMSAKAKTILASWASFDDPITVILAIYAPLLTAQLLGVDMGSLTGAEVSGSNFAVYFREFGLNIGLAGGMLALWFIIRYYAKKIRAWPAGGLAAAAYGLLAVAFSMSVLYFTMLGIALIGLFLRPSKLDTYIGYAVVWALRIAAVLLGLLLVGGIDIGKGIALGVAAYFAQVIVGSLLTRTLPSKDRWHISFAQQNGITAIILALLFEPIHAGTVAIVAPAIIVVNSLHWLMNKLIDKRLQL